MLSHILAGIKIVDLTQNVAGPFCTQVLGDFGADIIKVERPGRGDDTRLWQPALGEQSATFPALNRNKRSVCIDLDRPVGIEVIRSLIRDADVVARCADGHVFIAAGNDNLFRRVCTGLGCPAVADDPRFGSNTLRLQHRADLRTAIEACTQDVAAASVVEALRQAGAPCSEMHDVSQMLNHPQVAASGMLADLPVEGAAQHRVVATPIRAAGERCLNLRPPPGLGADTDAVLAECGYDATAIAALREQGAIG